MQKKSSVKYDRQIRDDNNRRLWKEHGQSMLESAHVCLFGATATGTEAVKNLVLPGIKAFTIIDDSVVSQQDLGVNFFLEECNVGVCGKAEALVKHLRELNEDVEGFYVSQKPEEYIKYCDMHVLTQFSLVIASGIAEDSVLDLEQKLLQLGIPLIICSSIGLIGYLRLSCPENIIVETHAEFNHDLRLDCPWQELDEHADSFDFENLDSMEKAHVPYIVLLLKARKRWIQINEGKSPQTREEKTEFNQKFIFNMLGELESRENLDEASTQSYRLFSKTQIPFSVETLLNDIQLSPLSKLFKKKVLLKALQVFVKRHNQLPLVGTVPDMKADTRSYIAIQNIYHKKAIADSTEMKTNVEEILETFEMSREAISKEEIDRFCKNASLVTLMKWRSIAEELKSLQQSCNLVDISVDEKRYGWYFAFKACQKFFSMYKRYPGEGEERESDVSAMKKIFIKWTNVNIFDEYLDEMCRYGGCELHNIAAFMGGIASQECIKLITEQYLPLNNTLIFDGLESKCYTFEA